MDQEPEQKDVKLSFGALKPHFERCGDSALQILSVQSTDKPENWDDLCIGLAVYTSFMVNEVCKQVQSQVVDKMDGNIKVLENVLQSIDDHP